MVEEEKNPLEGQLGETADPKAIKEKTRKASSRAQRDIDDLATILSDIRGRRFIRRYLDETGVFKQPFNNSGSITAFNCGMMNVGQKLWAECNEADPEALILMQAEFKKETQNA